MTIATLAIAAAVVVILVLVCMVVGLQRRLRRLAAEVRDLTARAVSVAEPSGTPAPGRTAAHPSGAPDPDGSVAVITGLRADGERGPSGELTTGRVVTFSLAGPMIKVVALTHGVRRALDEEHRLRIAYAFRKELKRQRKLRRKAAATRPGKPAGGRP